MDISEKGGFDPGSGGEPNHDDGLRTRGRRRRRTARARRDVRRFGSTDPHDTDGPSAGGGHADVGDRMNRFNGLRREHARRAFLAVIVVVIVSVAERVGGGPKPSRQRQDGEQRG